MKIGRNIVCPCGSGKKYKRCCLDAARLVTMSEGVPSKIAELQRLEAERIDKYGHVRPPITNRFEGQTFVAIGSRLLYNSSWKTFHEFLLSYVGDLFPKDWITAQESEPFEQRHPLLQWHQIWIDFSAAHPPVAPGIIKKVDSPPAAISALLSFAYDLYTLEHHSLLPSRLIERLQRRPEFQGARYETYVAAAFVRAGFSIILEDEEDQTSSHCEFTATHNRTGKQYSVEAKSRHRNGYLGQAGKSPSPEEIEADLSGLFVKALRKNAKHDRIVFIDINVPPSESSIPNSEWFNKVGVQLNRYEKTAQADNLPPALVFFTNWPYHFIENGGPIAGSSIVCTGFCIPEFHPNSGGNDVLIRTKFPEVLELHDSAVRHTTVPHELI